MESFLNKFEFLSVKMERAAYVLFSIAIFGFLLYLLALKLDSRPLSIAGLLISLSMIVLIKLIISYFTKKGELLIIEDAFVFTFISKNNIKVKEVAIYLDKIEKYKILNHNKYNSIVFYFNNAVFKISFLKNENPKRNFDEWEVIDAIHTQIRRQNERTAADKQILLVPSFYASKFGLIIISTLATAQVIVIIINFVVNPKLALGFILLGSALIIQLLAKRIGAFKILNKYKSHLA